MDKDKLMFEIRVAELRSNKMLRIMIRECSEYLDKNPDDEKFQHTLLASCIVLCQRYIGISESRK